MKNNIVRLRPKNKNLISFETIRNICVKHCEDIISEPHSPWGKHGNPIVYFIQNGYNRLGLNQRTIIKFLHKEYFSRGKPCYLKRGNIIKQTGINKDKENLTRTIRQLINYGILSKITYETKRRKMVFLLPNLFSYEETNNLVKEYDYLDFEMTSPPLSSRPIRLLKH